MSTNPGVTSNPSAAMLRSAVPSTRPTSVTAPSRIATSAVRAGAPVPSTTVPPRITRSWSGMSAPSGAERGQHLVTEEPARGGRVLAVGAEARTGDDETVDAEAVQLTQAVDDDLRRADDREAIDELGPQRARVLGRVVEMVIAVVAAPLLRDDLAGAGREARAGRAGRRREVRERGDAAGDECAGGLDVGMATDVHVHPERDVGGVAPGRSRGGARDAECPGDPLRVGTDRERHLLGDAAGELEQARSRRGDVERDLRRLGAVEPPQPAGGAVAVDGVAREIALQ